MSAECGVRSAELKAGKILVLFAVRDEARYFKPPTGTNCDVSVSGIGQCNAEHALRRALETGSPRLVLTCGYAGGLNPALRPGQVIFDADAESGLAEPLEKLGARPVRFHCAEQVIVTAAEKQALWQLTNADAVEMESGIIREICQRHHLPSATIRVISDEARRDLPMDFNQLAGDDGNISTSKLALALLKSPALVPKLMRFQRELGLCGRELGRVLHELVRGLAQGRP